MKQKQKSQKAMTTKVPRKTKKTSKKLKPVESSSDDDQHNGLDDLQLCNDDSDGDVEDGTRVRPVRRKVDAQSSVDMCLVCGEFGRDKELWYRCRVCALWAHEACTSATCDNNYVCEHCDDS